jgi:multidrug efflux pump subunit AcrA (membrane-fusion protein)
MWIVRLALRRPYMCVVMAMMIVVLSVATVLRTPIDIVPEVNIPVVAVVWIDPGVSPDDMEKRTQAIHARTDGYLKNWWVDIGDEVKKDDRLADIETPEIDKAKKEAEATLGQSRANLVLAVSKMELANAIMVGAEGTRVAVVRQGRDGMAVDDEPIVRGRDFAADVGSERQRVAGLEPQ